MRGETLASLVAREGPLIAGALAADPGDRPPSVELLRDLLLETRG